MKRTFFLSWFLLLTAGMWGQDKLLSILNEELRHNMQELQLQEAKPYFMSLRVEDIYRVTISSNFGVINESSDEHVRLLVPQVRLGDKELDNFKYETQGNGNQRGQGANPALLPLDDNATEAIRVAIWGETLERYKYAYNAYEQTKSRASTTVADEDKAPCFSDAPVERYYEAAPSADKYDFDRRPWEERLNAVSKVFQDYPELQEGAASLTYEVIRTYLVNTDGTEVVQNRIAARVLLQSQVMADDGMELPLLNDYFAYDINELPDVQVMVADARQMLGRLRDLVKAPVANPYTGPAILSGPASGVFFHEIFGHRLEGHRLKEGGETFKNMVGKLLLPQDFQVYCDPTLRRYADTDLNGYYLYDSEGVKARRVNNIVDGVLREFLMSRVPLDGFPVSNGHGRTSENCDAVSRQSNLVVETTRPYTEAQLRQMLIAEACKQGKDYGYYFKSVTSGYTLTGEGGSLNSFNVTPIEVYRVYVDGRPDELVRGVDLIGTPLAMFSNIAAAGDQPSVFTGSCGAESGWVPVTASSPMIFVSQIETQRREKNREIQPILSAPAFVASAGDSDDIIFSAMQDELRRTTDSLALGGAPTPFYAGYVTNKYRNLNINAELGGLNYSTYRPGMSGLTQVMVGDYMRNNAMQAGQFYNTGIQDDAYRDYANLRRSFWELSDKAYKASLNEYARKMAYLTSHPQPQELAELPDLQQTAPCDYRMDEQAFDVDQQYLNRVAIELSAIFKGYPHLYNTYVDISGSYMDTYRSTSEQVNIKNVSHYVILRVGATFRSEDGTPISDELHLAYAKPSDMPALDELHAVVARFADGVMDLRAAPAMDKFYKGPVMFEDLAASHAFTRNLLSLGNLYARPSMQPSSSSLGVKIGYKIIDGRITIKNYTDKAEYGGKPLMGYYTIDADGIRPASEMTLIDKGILKMQLNRTTPSEFAHQSTGSARFSNRRGAPTTSIGTLHIQADKTTTANKMKAQLIKAGKKEKLQYVYKVSCPDGYNTMRLYRIDVKTGEETLMKTNNLSLPSMKELENVLAISSREKVDNRVGEINTSVIYPESLILDYYEINKADYEGENTPELTYPLLRK